MPEYYVRLTYDAPGQGGVEGFAVKAEDMDDARKRIVQYLELTPGGALPPGEEWPDWVVQD